MSSVRWDRAEGSNPARSGKFPDGPAAEKFRPDPSTSTVRPVHSIAFVSRKRLGGTTSAAKTIGTEAINNDSIATVPYRPGRRLGGRPRGPSPAPSGRNDGNGIIDMQCRLALGIGDDTSGRARCCPSAADVRGVAAVAMYCESVV
jgi:hypothetical protein